MRSMGFEPRQSEINQLISKMMENEVARNVSSDQFSLEELLYILEDKLTSNDANNEIHSAFELFDIKKKGYIDFAGMLLFHGFSRFYNFLRNTSNITTNILSI